MASDYRRKHTIPTNRSRHRHAQMLSSTHCKNGKCKFCLSLPGFKQFWHGHHWRCTVCRVHNAG
eukprot:13708538-Ditylum_brightwellii.AAC.1